ncbi:unnamed protein product [Moneuplotes crassus]|uniref:non-specific serine/threonine protein kinase n=1 Tax=Euplotes crassus TaxID=5936 RepID=A0AAD1XA06_EUPCR|nr:unnamed protein product [Moneuplotes crassus]
MTSLKDFTMHEELGAGAYSKVNRVTRTDDKQEYALKRVFLSKLTDKEKENALNEVRILASISSENVVSYKEAFWATSPSSLCIIMELANGGDLYDMIKKHKKAKTFFSEEKIWDIFIQIVKGLKILHAHKVLHRDLKCANVFLNKDGTVKLGDLNVSKVAKAGLVYTQTGTPYYASPEVWKDKPYNSKSDIWSLGVVLYEMCTLNPPFTDTSMQGLCKKVMKGIYPSLPSRYSKDLSTMIATLLNVSATKRPSCSQILHMPACEEHLLEEENYEISQELLNTIKLPRNLKHLNTRLPKSQYEDEEAYKCEASYSHQELPQKKSYPILPPTKSQDSLPQETKREVDKYEAIAEIERRYGDKESRAGKKERQIPRSTPSSGNSIPNIYNKYAEEARDIAESAKKKNYLKLKEKYNQRAKEIEQIEKEKRMLRNRVANGVAHNASYDYPREIVKRQNYHQMRNDRRYDLINHMNSRSEDYRDSAIKTTGKAPSIKKRNFKLPSTSKELDNLPVNDNERRKARILRHAEEIRQAVSLNREKASGSSSGIYKSSGVYSPSVPKWWG